MFPFTVILVEVQLALQDIGEEQVTVKRLLVIHIFVQIP